jgi:hypothetical protein
LEEVSAEAIAQADWEVPGAGIWSNAFAPAYTQQLVWTHRLGKSQRGGNDGTVHSTHHTRILLVPCADAHPNCDLCLFSFSCPFFPVFLNTPQQRLKRLVP